MVRCFEVHPPISDAWMISYHRVLSWTSTSFNFSKYENSTAMFCYTSFLASTSYRSWWWPTAERLIKYYSAVSFIPVEGRALVEAKKDVKCRYQYYRYSTRPPEILRKEHANLVSGFPFKRATLLVLVLPRIIQYSWKQVHDHSTTWWLLLVVESLTGDIDIPPSVTLNMKRMGVTGHKLQKEVCN